MAAKFGEAQAVPQGEGAIKLTCLSCRTFAANAVRLQLHALAYNLCNVLRTLATPEPIKEWPLTSLQKKLIKVGAKIISHGRYVAFQMAEVAILTHLFAGVLRIIAELQTPPDPEAARGGQLSCVLAKTQGELCLEECEIYVPRMQRAGITALANRRCHLPKFRLANAA